MGVRDRIPRMISRLADTEADRVRRERTRGFVARWNDELAGGDLPLWSPSIRAALLAGTPWLEVLCPACASVGAVSLSRVDRHPEAGIASLVLGLTCSRCGPHAPMPRLLGLHALPPSAGMGAAAFGEAAETTPLLQNLFRVLHSTSPPGLTAHLGQLSINGEGGTS